MAAVNHSKHQMAPVPFTPVEGSGSDNFSNMQLVALAVIVPLLVNLALGLSLYWFPVFAALLAVPVFIANHMLQSVSGVPNRPQVGLPGKPTDAYLDFKNSQEFMKYNSKRKIPIETFFEAYFDEKIDIKGGMLEILEARYDWASFSFTMSQMAFFFTQWLPETLWHSKKQDEEQVRNHYDRGDDFYNWFCKFTSHFSGPHDDLHLWHHVKHY